CTSRFGMLEVNVGPLACVTKPQVYGAYGRSRFVSCWMAVMERFLRTLDYSGLILAAFKTAGHLVNSFLNSSSASSMVPPVVAAPLSSMNFFRFVLRSAILMALFKASTLSLGDPA